MKTHFVFLLVGLLMITSLKGQVKIGNNPQNLDPASVLELESSNRVLVITRVTTAQMSTISPLRGALVYNTDEECIHYYNGVEWINICEALDNSFTVSTNAIFNTAPDARDSTIVVTQTETPDGINYNFEVNRITGDNVYNGTLFGSDLAPQTVGGREIQNSSVGLEKLEDGTVLGQLMQWDGTQWTLISEADINVTEADGEIGNEILDAADGTLVRSGSGDALDPFVLDVSPEGIGNGELALNAVTNDKLDKANIPLSGFGAATGNVGMGGFQINNLLDPTLAQDAATKNYVDTEITDNAADGTETIVTVAGINAITGDGSATTPYLITATEAQDLADVIALDPSAGNSQITDVVDPTDTQDAATKNYVDTEITDNAADGTETIVTVAGINAITGDGSATTPYLITATEAQDLADVIALDPSAGNSQITDVVNPTDPQDVATKAYVDNINVSEGEGITVAQTVQDFEVAVTNPVVAMGKINSDGSNDLGKLIGATIDYDPLSPGIYNVSFNPGRNPGDDNYIVQLTLLDSPNGTTIKTTNHTVTGFTVEVFSSGAPTNSNWYFTVTDF